MIYVLATAFYLAVFVGVAVISERWSPLWGVGGLVLTLAVLRWLA